MANNSGQQLCGKTMLEPMGRPSPDPYSEAEFDRWIADHLSFIYEQAGRECSSSAIGADELAQDCLIRLHRYLVDLVDTDRPIIVNERAYLSTMIRYRHFDLLRENDRRRSLCDRAGRSQNDTASIVPTELAEVLQELDAKDQRVAYAEVLKALNAKDQRLGVITCFGPT